MSYYLTASFTPLARRALTPCSWLGSASSPGCRALFQSWQIRMIADNVIHLNARRTDLHDAITSIKEIIYSKAGTMSLAEAIGLLEIAKMEILLEQSED